MPDADRFGKVSRRWSRMAQKVSEGHFDNASLANDAMKPLRKEIEQYGRSMYSLLKNAATYLKTIQKSPLFLVNHDWNEEEVFIRDLCNTYTKRYQLNQRAKNLAILAYQDLVHALRTGEFVEGNLYEVLLHTYIRRIYDSNFAVPLILTVEAKPDIDSNAIGQRLHGMDMFINENIDELVAHIARIGRMGRSKGIHSITSKAISINDDIFSLGSGK
jgi:hypothetical protein